MATTATSNAASVGKYLSIAVGDLRPSKSNARRVFDPVSLKQLAADMELRGVLEPILVRQVPNGQGASYEIVAGERRFRAAKMAGLATVPCVVHDWNDVEAAEAQLCENILRDDLTPMDESDAYRRLRDEFKMSVQTIAKRINQSIAYVYEFLKLAECIEPVKKAMATGPLTVGHGILIARLTPEMQAKTLRYALQREGDVVSVKELIRYIKEQIYLDLSAAAFKKDDEKLLPEAGPCTTCPKRLGNQPGTAAKDAWTCTDAACFQAKTIAFAGKEQERLSKGENENEKFVLLSTDHRDARVSNGGKAAPVKKGAQQVRYLYGDGTREVRAKADACPSTISGVIVTGQNDEMGVKKLVCIDLSCKKHHQYSGNSTREPSPAQKARESKARAQEKVDADTRTEVFTTIAEIGVQQKFGRWFLETCAFQMFDRLWNDHKRKLFSMRGWEPLKGKGMYAALDYDSVVLGHIAAWNDQQLKHFMLQVGLIKALQKPYGSGVDELLVAAKAVKINFGAVQKQHAKLAAEAAKAKLKKQPTKKK